MVPPDLRSIFIVCNDIDQSVVFYRDLGFEFVEDKRRSTVMSTGNGLQLHLHRPLSAEESAHYGVEWQPGSKGLVACFESDDIEKIARSVSNDQLLCPPSDTPWGDRIVVVSDPDGHRLEFRERTTTQ